MSSRLQAQCLIAELSHYPTGNSLYKSVIYVFDTPLDVRVTVAKVYTRMFGVNTLRSLNDN